jgi:tRNA (guanine-N7-)-methyltransferase
MGKGKLAKFADMAEYPHVFEYPYSVVDDVPFEMKGNWNRDFFKNDHPIVLELGCGRGEYTVGLARRYPEKNFIGVDIKGARMWTGATDALKEGLTNAAFLRTNIEIIDRFFAPGEVSEIWLTFSDPQMKKATKRLTSTYFMNRYRRFLVPDGLVHLKTDSNFMFTYTKYMIEANHFPVEFMTDDLYHSGMDDDILSIRTYYEQQWLDRGISATGAVKNLILGQAVYNKENDTKNAAFLAGINRGEINNCILQNCTVEIIRDDSDFGNLTNWNEGIIINCHVDNVRLKNEIPQGNALTRYNQGGKIINCAVTNCNFSKAKNRSGLICSITKNGEILNCYLKGNTSKNHAICLQTENTNIRCCYYPYGDTREPVGNNYVSAPSDSIMQYGSQQSITEDNLYQILNQWVRDSGAKLYPESSFLLWEKGETLPAILVSP